MRVPPDGVKQPAVALAVTPDQPRGHVLIYRGESRSAQDPLGKQGLAPRIRSAL